MVILKIVSFSAFISCPFLFPLMMSSDDLLSYELAEGEDPALLNEDELLLSDDGKLSGGRRFLLILCGGMKPNLVL